MFIKFLLVSVLFKRELKELCNFRRDQRECLPEAVLTVLQKPEVMSNTDGPGWASYSLQMIAAQVEV